MPTFTTVVGIVHRESFVAVGATLKIFERRVENRIVESRELHVIAEPHSKEFRKLFGSINFRVIDETLSRSVDGGGRPIVGGLNSSPQPVHAVITISPAAMTLLNDRLSRGISPTISVTLSGNVSEWNQDEALWIYEAEIVA